MSSFDYIIKNRSIAKWHSALGLAQLLKTKGKYWNKCGISVNGVNFLYPEEALWLLDVEQVYFVNDISDREFLNKQEVYQLIFSAISIPVYLTYLKLKSLDYIVVRHNKKAQVFANEIELFEAICRVEGDSCRTLVDVAVSYDIFLDDQNFTKKAVANKDITPVGYVIICDGENVLPGRVLEVLVREAMSVPVLVAAATSTATIILEEFTDAETMLDFANIQKTRKRKELSDVNSLVVTDS
jgi:hypothetical protein